LIPHEPRHNVGAETLVRESVATNVVSTERNGADRSERRARRVRPPVDVHGDWQAIRRRRADGERRAPIAADRRWP